MLQHTKQVSLKKLNDFIELYYNHNPYILGIVLTPRAHSLTAADTDILSLSLELLRGNVVMDAIATKVTIGINSKRVYRGHI